MNKLASEKKRPQKKASLYMRQVQVIFRSKKMHFIFKRMRVGKRDMRKRSESGV